MADTDRDPRCTCPLPYRAIEPVVHEESCPVVASAAIVDDLRAEATVWELDDRTYGLGFRSPMVMRLRKAADEIERLRMALDRLASPEAFVVSRMATDEEHARMRFAADALAQQDKPEGR